VTGKETTAVLLMAYGSPNSVNEVEPYLLQVKGGRQSTQEQIERLKERYRQVGGRTPLLQITQAQAVGLKNKLRSEGFDLPVYFGMKHWNPFIEDVVHNIIHNGASSLIGIALAPHYSRLSIGGYETAVLKGLAKEHSKIPFTTVKSWHKQDQLITALARRVSNSMKSIQTADDAVVLFTAHSLPKNAVGPDDPYQSQLQETSRLVAKSAGVDQWDFAFQSAGEPKEAWLGPQILEQITRLVKEKGFSKIVVCPIGFVSDHLEILYDLDIEARQCAQAIGATLQRTSSLNDDPELIDALASVTTSALKELPQPMVLQ
jgi:protoporphyrin/coproporphyrin ferrochelatase